MSPGERRRRQRKRLIAAKVAEDKILAARAMGGRCGNCRMFDSHPHIGDYCELGTDFWGYAKTSPDSICSQWETTK